MTSCCPAFVVGGKVDDDDEFVDYARFDFLSDAILNLFFTLYTGNPNDEFESSPGVEQKLQEMRRL